LDRDHKETTTYVGSHYYYKLSIIYMYFIGLGYFMYDCVLSFCI